MSDSCEVCHKTVEGNKRARLTLNSGDRVAYCRRCLILTAIPQGRLRGSRMLEVTPIALFGFLLLSLFLFCSFLFFSFLSFFHGFLWYFFLKKKNASVLFYVCCFAGFVIV